MSSNNNITFDPPQKHPKSPQQILNKINSAVENTKSVIPGAFIHRVPKEIRSVNESVYTPRLVSIGPLHLPCEAQQHIPKSSMQDIKMYYVDSLLDRVSQRSSESKLKLDVLKECVDEMKQLTEDAKKCYAEQVEEVLDEEMLVIDGCFILELLYRYHMYRPPDVKSQNQTQSEESSSQEVPDNDTIFKNPLTFITVQHDLLLVENQLPFFVLEKLFSLTVACIQNRFPPKPLREYVHSYFEDMMAQLGRKAKNCCSPGDCILSVFPGSKMNPEGSAQPEHREVQCHHILHILHHRYSVEEEKEKVPATEDKSESMPCASELVDAGVKFKACNGEYRLRAKFSEIPCPFWCCCRARFEIPTLYIDDSTELFLRNLIAFEQCLPSVSNHFTSYAMLMDRLVNDEKDITVLEKAGVICNTLGTAKEAYDLFNKLCKEVGMPSERYFTKTCTHAFNYSQCCWPKNIAFVRSKYFATPWSFIAFCVAFILFAISITQFIRSFHS